MSDGNSDGVPDKPSSSLLRAKSTTEYDERGRVFASHTFSVEPSTRSVSSNSLDTETWYDPRGLVIKSEAPGGLVTKTDYDGLGRSETVYSTDGSGDSGYTDADDVSGDKVLEQSTPEYDDVGNAIKVTSKQRFHDETATGALGDASTSPKARVSYQGAYYDEANRLTASVNVGTNGGSAWTRPGTVPTRSDTVLVTSQTYNSAGWVEEITDPKGIVMRTEYDDLGQVTKTIEHYTNGTVTDTSNKTVEYGYEAPGLRNSLSVKLTGGGSRLSAWNFSTRGGGASSTSEAAFIRGGFMRMSASSANSPARLKARSDSPPSARACSRQAIRLTSHALLWPLVSSPNTSAYLCRNCFTVIRVSAWMSRPTSVCMRFASR